MRRQVSGHDKQVRLPWLIIVSLGFILILLPVLLSRTGVLVRPDNRIVQASNGLYWIAVAGGLVFTAVRESRRHKQKPLTGFYSLQGLASIWVGVSGLILLAAFAPRFPENTLVVYLAGAGIIVLFAAIPLLLFEYARRQLRDSEIKR